MRCRCALFKGAGVQVLARAQFTHYQSRTDFAAQVLAAPLYLSQPKFPRCPLVCRISAPQNACKYLQGRKPPHLFAVNTKFRNFAWGVLAYNILVIIWGAYVRASRSGDGCGDHWPNCNGELIPNAASHTKTWVEYAHRGMTVVDGFLILALVIWAFRIYPKKHPVRLGASLSMGFVLVEALIGAFLVKFKLVAESQSEYRAVAMSLHLINTLFLVAALTLTAWWALGKPRLKLFEQGAMGFAILANMVAVIALAVTGALAALGDTVFPAANYDELIVLCSAN